MGLDQTIECLPEGVKPEGPCLAWEQIFNVGSTQIAYWRKHYDIDQWMERLYYEKGGARPKNGRWNNVGLVLTKEDLKALAAALIDGEIVDYENDYESLEPSLSLKDSFEAIARAAHCINLGRVVYYEPSR